MPPSRLHPDRPHTVSPSPLPALAPFRQAPPPVSRRSTPLQQVTTRLLRTFQSFCINEGHYAPEAYIRINGPFLYPVEGRLLHAHARPAVAVGTLAQARDFCFESSFDMESDVQSLEVNEGIFNFCFSFFFAIRMGSECSEQCIW